MSLNDVQHASDTAHCDRLGHRSGAAKPSGKKGVLAGGAVVVACMVGCSLPLIAAGGALVGVGAFIAGGEGVALGVVVAAIVIGGLMLFRRDTAARGDGCGPSCGC